VRAHLQGKLSGKEKGRVSETKLIDLTCSFGSHENIYIKKSVFSTLHPSLLQEDLLLLLLPQYSSVRAGAILPQNQCRSHTGCPQTENPDS
jgi:hypothetical protein